MKNIHHIKYFALLLIFIITSLQSFSQDTDITLASSTRVNVSSGTTVVVPDNLKIESSAVLDLTGNMTVSGDLTNNAGASGLVIQSDASNNGSLIVYGTATGNVTAQRYISNGQWHSICSPVDGATAQSLYSTIANVYLKYHTESTNVYTNVTSLSTDLGDMLGWMMWYAGSSGETFDITGTIRGNSTVSKSLSRQIDGATRGWNFAGNPFTSAIDWNASSGWTKTNVGSTIYVYNNGNWATWNGSTAVNGGSRYIASGQGFFVEVLDGQTTGTLAMTNDVQLHNAVNFLKTPEVISELVRLEVSNGSYSDETLIYFIEEATDGYDFEFDAHKLFSFNENIPQIYSTNNDFMAINVLPVANTEIPLDVRGIDGETMSISATEILGFGDVDLLDNYTGAHTNLSENGYEFLYDEDITDRFILFFTTVGNNEELNDLVNIYSYNKNIRVVIPEIPNTEISVYSVVGQLIAVAKANERTTEIPILNSGYYIVKVITNCNIITAKVFVK